MDKSIEHGRLPASEPWKGFISLRDVFQITGLGKTTIRSLENDGRFPARFKVAGGRKVAFWAHEVYEWMEVTAKGKRWRRSARHEQGDGE